MICEVCGCLREDCECERKGEDIPREDTDDPDNGNWIHDPDMGDQ